MSVHTKFGVIWTCLASTCFTKVQLDQNCNVDASITFDGWIGLKFGVAGLFGMVHMCIMISLLFHRYFLFFGFFDFFFCVPGLFGTIHMCINFHSHWTHIASTC